MICLLCMTRVCFAEQIAGASLILLVPTSREKLGKVINLQLDETQADDWSFQRKCLVEQVSGANGASNTDLNTINENQQNVKRTGRCAH